MFDDINGIICMVLLVAYCIFTWKDIKYGRAAREQYEEVNKLLLKQNMEIRKMNDELIKANQNLNAVIVSVCSKSVRDRRKQNEEAEKGNALAEAETQCEASCSGER